jgi:hypothetical protein
MNNSVLDRKRFLVRVGWGGLEISQHFCYMFENAILGACNAYIFQPIRICRTFRNLNFSPIRTKTIELILNLGSDI